MKQKYFLTKEGKYKIYSFMKRYKLNQQDLAKTLGVSRTNTSLILNGKKSFNNETLIILSGYGL